MVERHMPRPLEGVHKFRQKPIKEKVFTVMEAASVAYGALFVASAVTYLALEQYDYAKESAIGALRMALITTTIYAMNQVTNPDFSFDKTKIKNVIDKYNPF